MARNNADLAHEIEELIKKYNKKPEKKIKKRDIIELFQQCEVIVAAKVDYSDCQIIGEFIENASLKPDVVKDGKRTRLMPVFTTFEQIPVEYMDNFSLIRMSASAAYTYMNDCEELNGLVINPFTEANLELRKKRMTNPNSDATRNFGNTIQPKRAEKPVVNQGEALIIYNNQKFVINKSPFVIGRESADITIPETYISKIHVIISYKDGKYRIADYDSTNGTKVNGTKLRPKVYYEIRDGYEIELSEKEKMIVYIN